MRVFTVHIPPAAEAASREPVMPVLVPEGFSWSALIFGPFWLLRFGLWLPLLIWVALSVAINLWAGRHAGWADLALQLLLAAEAQDLRRWALSRRGWRETGVVTAPDAEAALLRQLEAAQA